MKTLRRILFFFFVSAVMLASAQTVDQQTENMLSQKFADGLREFYSADYKSAETSFRYVLSKNPSHDASYFMLAKIRNQQKEYAGASYYLQEAIKLDKKNIWYKVMLAETYDLMNDYAASTKLWKEICKLQPANEQYLILLSQAYLNNEQYKNVVKTYDQIEILIGYNEEITEAKKNIWLYFNDVKRAAGEYDKLIKEFPYEPKHYVNAGNIYLTNGMPEKALTYYKRAAEIAPNDPYANMAMANYYQQKGDEDNYYNVLLRAFQSHELAADEKLTYLKQYLTAAMKNRGNAQTQSRCEKLASTFVEVHPDMVEGWATMGILKLNMGKYEDAKMAFERSLSMDNTHFTIWEDYLFVLSQLKDYKTIISCEKDLSELFPSNASMMYCLGRAFQKEGNPTKALEYLKAASTYSYDSRQLAQIYNTMGDAYQALDNKEDAMKYWRMAKQKGMNTQELKNKLGE
ncbi:MAG: tetratricopeptide repeat protein [Bacteroidales bacterium]|nr:tetratricopeptide repeat protein [Bacteroidales bacterium]